MKKALQNTAVGMLVSFAGSVPLGYLNIAGYELYARFGWASLLPYILGIITIESLVIFGTLLFADRLSRRKRLIRYIEIFSIAFMFALAVVFFLKQQGDEQDVFFRKYLNHAPYVTGVLLSAINFMQLPFWLAWNLYVVGHGYVAVDRCRKWFYLTGTLCGTFAGIALISAGLDYLGSNSTYFSQKLMPNLFPIVFLLLGLWQSFAYWRKYHRKH